MKRLSTYRSALGLSFAPDGRTLACVGWQYVGLWDVVTGQEVQIRQNPCQYVMSVAWSPDGNTLVWAAQMGGPAAGIELRAGTIRQRQQQARQRLPTSARVYLGFTPNGRALASYPGGLVIWHTGFEPAPWDEVRRIDGALAVSRDGTMAATGQSTAILPHSISRPPAILIWDIGSGKIAAVLPIPTGTPDSIAFSPDNAYVAATVNGNLRLWHIPSKREVMERGEPGFHAVTFLPQSQQLLAAGKDSAVYLFEAATGKLLNKYGWEAGISQILAVSPDGLLAATAGYEGDIVVWDLEG